MTYWVFFEGGPRDGKLSDRYPRNPKIIGCRDECDAAGIPRGVYRDSGRGEGKEESPRVLYWYLPKSRRH